jgi:hypothetical protein
VEPLGAELRPRRNCSERAGPDCGRGPGAGDPGSAQTPDGDPVDLPADRNARVDRGAGSVSSANQDAPDRTRTLPTGPAHEGEALRAASEDGGNASAALWREPRPTCSCSAVSPARNFRRS